MQDEINNKYSDSDTDLFFMKYAKAFDISDKNSISFKNHWYKSQLHYLEMISLIKANKLEQNIDLIFLNKESLVKIY